MIQLFYKYYQDPAKVYTISELIDTELVYVPDAPAMTEDRFLEIFNQYGAGSLAGLDTINEYANFNALCWQKSNCAGTVWKPVVCKQTNLADPTYNGLTFVGDIRIPASRYPSGGIQRIVPDMVGGVSARVGDNGTAREFAVGLLNDDAATVPYGAELIPTTATSLTLTAAKCWAALIENMSHQGYELAHSKTSVGNGTKNLYFTGNSFKGVRRS